MNPNATGPVFTGQDDEDEEEEDVEIDEDDGDSGEYGNSDEDCTNMNIIVKNDIEQQN